MITIEDLTYHYPEAKSPTLKSISLHVNPGELVLITGHSGSGKSTLFHCLKGLLPHLYGGTLEGKILADGQDLSKMRVADISVHVGLVMQDPDTQFCNLFVRDEVAFGVENLKLPAKECVARVQSALAAVGLLHASDRLVIELSGGEKQRVAIASVLAMDPPVMLLDEPAANLDAKSGREILNFVAELRRGGKTILLVQHDLDEMIHVADKLLILERGEVLDYGPPRALIEKYGATLTSAHHIGLPQVTLAALGARRAFGSASLPLTVQEFASWVLKPPQHGAAQPRSPEVIGTGQALARPAVVDAEDVSYAYPRAVNQVVKKVSLRVQEGEVVAILGKNGSGKSTLARLLVGLLKPRQGVIRLGNRDVAQLRHHDIHRLSGYVFQYPEHQFLTNSVQDEIGYGLEVQSVPRAEQQRIIADVVASLGLAGLEARHPFTLSGGEKRRLSVATMLVLEPRLLILDEPTYGLDEGNVVNLVRLMFEQLRHRGITFLFITHDMRLVAEYADRALVMHHGELVFDGAPKDLFRDSALLERSELLAPPVVELTNTLAQRGLAVPDGTITVLQLCQALNWVYAQESEKL